MKRITLEKAAKTRQTFRTKCPVKIVRKAFTKADGSPGESVTLQGYPILWNENSSDRGGYVVRLAPNSALFTTPVQALFHHNFAAPLGTTDNGTLRIGNADAKGIPIEIDLNMDTTVGRDVAAWVDRGDIKGMSFAMANGFETYTEAGKADGLSIIEVSKYTVDEVTVTGIPAFDKTSIAVKASDDEEDDDPNNDSQEMAALVPKNRITASLKQARNKLYLLAPAR